MCGKSPVNWHYKYKRVIYIFTGSSNILGSHIRAALALMSEVPPKPDPCNTATPGLRFRSNSLVGFPVNIKNANKYQFDETP